VQRSGRNSCSLIWKIVTLFFFLSAVIKVIWGFYFLRLVRNSSHTHKKKTLDLFSFLELGRNASVFSLSLSLSLFLSLSLSYIDIIISSWE